MNFIQITWLSSRKNDLKVGTSLILARSDQLAQSAQYYFSISHFN